MAIAYRIARAGDAARVAALFAESFTVTFGHVYAPEDLRSFLGQASAEAFRAEIADPRHRLRLAEDNGRLAGYLKLGPPKLPVETPPRTLELAQLYVLSPWQGAGVARELMAWALGESARLGAEHLQLSVWVENHRARRFYERYGFAEVGSFGFKVGSHVDDERVLRRALAARDRQAASW